MIPSMGGTEIGPWLSRAAADVPAGMAIVEVGAWLGAGTKQLAAGAEKSGAPIHCYDRWTANAQETETAAKFGVTLHEGQDLLPVMQDALAVVDAEIHYHKCRLAMATWRGGKIGVYVDDASKQGHVWARSMRVFSPSFVPGKTLLFLMDFHFDEQAGPAYAAQKRFVADRPDSFELLEDRLAETSCALFRFTKRFAC